MSGSRSFAIAAGGASSADLAAHEADTTNVHGIANTAVLETTTGAQTKADAAQAAAVGVVRLMRSGYYYGCDTATVSTSPRPEAVSYLTPIVIPRTLELDRIGVEVTVAGSTGALVRLGIHSTRTDASAGTPGPLVLDAGTVDGTLTGFLEKTISVVLTAGVYWLGATTQGAPVTAPTYRVAGTPNPLVSSLTALTVSNAPPIGYAFSSQPGALTDLGATTTSTATPIRVLIRVK